jgi:CRISPR-associated protein Csd2
MASHEPITRRHDLLILFEVTNGNPNGDPDAGNQPRVDALSQRGLVSDVCLKRKVRNYVELFPPAAPRDPEAATEGHKFKILIRQGAVLNREQERAIEATQGPEAKEKRGGSEKAKSDPDHARRVKDWLCREFYDVRTFGAVMSTGSEVMKGSAYGQIRGPVQFTFGQSFDPIAPQEVTITRCAVTKEEDVTKERTMGQKYIVPYGLYAARCYISPAFAENTGFDQADYDLLVEALTHLFAHDRSAARGEMVVRGLFDFEHVGTQGDANAGQNRREARLGCAHAHQLFESVRVDLKDRTRPPQGFSDYEVEFNGWGDDGRSSSFPGVLLHRYVDPNRRPDDAPPA